MIQFTEFERKMYNFLLSEMNKVFFSYVKHNAVGKNFSKCLNMLLRLRQSCNSLVLVAG